MENERGAPGSRDFAALLRHYRVAAGLSQAALAERAGMSSQGVSALERGFRRTPQRGTLALLAGALALDYEQRRGFEAAAARWVLLRDGGKGSSVLVGPWPDTASSNLPLSLASFVGRERELDEIAALVRDHRLVTLTGSGGIGKTQTALQLATALDEPGTVCFVGLAPISDPSLVPAAIASTLRVQEVPNRPQLETLLAYLKNRTLLLILDNCEHVVTQAATVAQTLLAGCPRVRIVATSREPLRSSGEQSYRLPSLSTPSREAAARLCARDATAYGAIQLFSDRARAVDHRFILTDENAPTVAHVCRQLDGIPLAIELAAARVNSLSLKALAEKLEHCFRILISGERTALPRQQTMRAVIDWSYDLLPPQERRLFERLSVFAGGCTLATATVVCAREEIAQVDVISLLSSLVDKSLVMADLDSFEPRYRLLESFRQYAHEKLVARDEHAVFSRRHALVFVELAERLERAWDTEIEGVWRELVQQDLDNCRAALEWSLGARGDVTLGQRLAGELWPVWAYLARDEGGRWIASAVDRIDKQTQSRVIAKLNYAQAWIAALMGEYEIALTGSKSALSRYRNLGDEIGVVRSQALAGFALTAFRRCAEAEPLLREALVGTRRLRAHRLLAQVLRLISMVHSFNGDVADARDSAAEALVIYEALGSERDAAREIAIHLASIEFESGDSELALVHASEGLATLRALNDTIYEAGILCNISEYLISLGRYDEAEARAREALDLPNEQQAGKAVVFALQRIASVAVLRPPGDAERRFQAYTQAARLWGYVDAQLWGYVDARLPRPETFYSAERREDNKALAALRDVLGADAFANLAAEGAVMTQEQAVAEATEI